MKLRTIQQPSRVEALLDAFVWSLDVLPENTRRITERSDLPAALQRVAIGAVKRQRAWGCWTDDYRIWMLTAEMSLSLSRERGCPVLLVDSYDQSGQLIEAGPWVLVREGSWRRCVV